MANRKGKDQPVGVPGEVRVKKGDVVTIVGTGAGKFLKKGAEAVVHRIQADKLVAKGVATIKE